MRRTAVIIAAVVALSACSWDSSLYDAFVDDNGEVLVCSNDKGVLSYIELEEGVKCYQGNAQILESPATKKCYSKWDCCGLNKETAVIVWNAFLHRMCPMQAHNCVTVEHFGDVTGLEDVTDISYCSYTDIVSCSFGYHFKGGKCVADDETSCGGKQCNIMGGWDGGSCELADGELRCIAENCKTGYHKRNGLDDSQNYVACEEDTVKHCGVDREACQKTIGVDIVVCEQGKCLNVRCSNGYHWDSSGEVCEEDDKTHCGSYNHDCTKLTGWNDGKCTHGVCEFVTCQSGYHIETDITTGNNVCVLDSNQACGNSLAVCDSNQQMICIQGECKHLTDCASPSEQCSGLGCVDVTSNIQACGGCQKECVIEHSSGVACQNRTCVATACTAGYHLYNGKCEEDSAANCGQHGFACQIEHATSTKCSNLKCIAEECSAGYRISNDKCVSDTNDCCGPSCTNCMNMKCENGACSDKCVGGYANCNGNKDDGCEIKLSDFGLVLEKGVCKCSAGYTQCGLYNHTSLPLCLVVSKNDYEYISDEYCEDYCNNPNQRGGDGNRYFVAVCNPTQLCRLQQSGRGDYPGAPPNPKPGTGEGNYNVVVCQ